MRSLLYSLGLLFIVGCSESEERGALTATPKDESEQYRINLDKRLSDWAVGAVKVKAVVFDCGEGQLTLGLHTNRRLVDDGVEHPFIVQKASKYLTTTEVAELASLVTGAHTPPDGAGCYVPHHGFIFYGMDNSIVANIEICLMCGNGVASPHQGLAESWDYKGLTKFIASIGLPVFEKAVEWGPYFAKLRAEQTGAGQPATAPESNSEGKKKPNAKSEVRPQ